MFVYLLRNVLVILSIINLVKSSCYFPAELIGIYKTQTIGGSDERYDDIQIESDQIPVWGHCHRRINNNVILKQYSEADIDCYFCFQLKLVARNILRVYTDKNVFSKCTTNETLVMESCPEENAVIDFEKDNEMILYKTMDFNMQAVRPQFCPVVGRFKFTYQNDVGMVQCPGGSLESDSCPSGSSMNLRFRNCEQFKDQRELITFECLGHWNTENQKYLALNITNLTNTLKYRCAVYEPQKNGLIQLRLSNDSTCVSLTTTSLHNNRRRLHNNPLESITLAPIKEDSWGSPSGHHLLSTFPDWMTGHWESLIISNNTIVYNDQTSFKQYKMKLLQNMKDVDSDHEAENKFMVFSQTQCNEKNHYCLWIKHRSENILEFQMGVKPARDFNNSICHSNYFTETSWQTLARLDRNSVKSPCPVTGNFEGYLPDSPALCTRLSSDNKSEDVMYYAVFDCNNTETVYEERDYRCLGQWQEGNLVYTYTKRRDFGTYECFVGAIDDKRIMIQEAGENCQRKINPLQHGMELKQINGIPDGHPNDSSYPRGFNDDEEDVGQIIPPSAGKPMKPSTISLMPSLPQTTRRPSTTSPTSISFTINDETTSPNEIIYQVSEHPEKDPTGSSNQLQLSSLVVLISILFLNVFV